MEENKIKKKYNKKQYNVIGDITFDRKSLELLKSGQNWSPKYYEIIKKKVLKKFKKKVIIAKKHAGTRQHSVYLKCSTCSCAAVLIAKTKDKSDKEMLFKLKVSCNCTTNEHAEESSDEEELADDNNENKSSDDEVADKSDHDLEKIVLNVPNHLPGKILQTPPKEQKSRITRKQLREANKKLN